MDNTVALAAIALSGTICTGFFALVSLQIKTHQKIAQALDRNTKSNESIAKETKQGNEEAKERNGHLAELVIQSSENTVKALKSVKRQNIKEQHIDHQEVKYIEEK